MNDSARTDSARTGAAGGLAAGTDVGCAAAGGKPDSAVRSDVAGRLAAAVNLRAFGSEGHIVDAHAERMLDRRRAVVHFRFANGGDGIRAGEPEEAVAVLQQLVDAVGGKALRGGELFDAAVAVAEEAIVARGEPEDIVAILKDGPDFFFCQRDCSGVDLECAVFQQLTPRSVPTIRRRRGLRAGSAC